MAKIILSTIGSISQNPTSAATALNDNFTTIQSAFDNTLSRDGTAPNQIGFNVDMNSNRLLNLPAPLTGSEPARLQDLSTITGGGTVTNIPAGGTTGQVIAKTDNADFDIAWINTVSSVGLSLPNDFTVTNSPVTTTGTLTAAWANTPTGSGSVVRAASPTITGPTISSPTVTGHPTIEGVTSTGATGTGAFVFATSPTLVTPNLGTPTAGVMTNVTGTASGLTAGNVTTNANLTGPITSTGNATAIASQTGTGTKFVVDTSPTLVTPTIGVATATSVNKVAITAPATSATLTIPNGVTLTGPASSGTAMTLGNAETVAGVKTFSAAPVISSITNTGTLTLPISSDTLVGRATTDTLTNKTIAGSSNTLSAIALSSLATQAANTLVGNFTGSSAVPTATDISTVTLKASPASTDIVLISDQAASGALKRTTVSALASAGSVGSINGLTGAVTIASTAMNVSPSGGNINLTLNIPDVIVEEQQTAGTDGGTFTSGSYVTRVLNTLVRNNGTIASLASNQVTLGAGTYFLKWTAAGFGCDGHKTKIRNITDSTDTAFGTSAYSSSTALAAVTQSEGSTVVTIAGSKAFALQHRCGTTRSANGQGSGSGFTTIEIFSRLEITKLA